MITVQLYLPRCIDSQPHRTWVTGHPGPASGERIAGAGFFWERELAGQPKTRAKKNRALAVQPTPEDLDRFKAAGIACGYDSDTMDRLAARCQGRPLSARGRVRLDDVELLATIDDRRERVLDYLDDHALSKMDGRNLMVAAGILIDKRQILKANPPRSRDMRTCASWTRFWSRFPRS